MKHDVLIVGGGIAGMEAALNLAEMNYRVLLVEKEASIGGKMVLLSKVFPTLDCASCISTPKMAATAHHPNIEVSTYSEVREIAQKADGGFLVKLRTKPSFIDAKACTGCAKCEEICTVAIPDPFNFDLAARRAAHIPFPQAVPKRAVIDRYGSSPCSFACPAGVKAHGYVSLVRSGRYEEAFHLHMEDAPLPGVLSRACYAPCEQACTRGALEGPVSIRAIKRFMVDRYYREHPDPEYGPPTKAKNSKVAVVGSGPAGLSAAYQLARRGYPVTVFESAPNVGGMLRYGIPTYRLPRYVLERDIKNIAALGVNFSTSSPVTSLLSLKEGGFDSIFLAVGTMRPVNMSIPGEDLDGVMDCMTFLRQTSAGNGLELQGKRVLLVGGGNACIDPARVALRLGAAKVIVQYRRSRAEMPAHPWEVEAALEEGVELQLQKVPKRFVGIDGHLVAVESLSMELGELDSSGRRRPIPIAGSERLVPVDLALLSIGLRPTTSPFRRELELNSDETIRVDAMTLETSLPSVFAGGDAVTGPSMIPSAIGQGKQAAFYIDHYLQGDSLTDTGWDGRLPAVDKDEVLRRFKSVSERNSKAPPQLPVPERLRGFTEIESSLSEEDARYNAGRCLDCGGCSECGECVRVCPADAIRLDMQGGEEITEVGSVILSTGFRLFDPTLKASYGYGRFPNVITAMQMDRLLSPTRPFSRVLRPSDGKAPDNIAFVLCTGSRDYTVGNRFCSRVCCMYSIKQSQLLMGALPLADVTIYYMDIRAFGKGYDEFYEQSKAMGVRFVKGKVARIEQTLGRNLIVHYEDVGGCGCLEKAEHDLVVLSVGLLSNPEVPRLFKNERLEVDEMDWIQETEDDVNPGRTSIEGVFVAGSAAGARDIPDTIVHAGAAAVQAAAYVEHSRTGK
jgi:heterodisulfide reductase subunit A-like polyferredoxin